MPEEEKKEGSDDLESLVSVSAAGAQGYIGWGLGAKYLSAAAPYSLYASAAGLAYLGYKGGQWAYRKVLKSVGSKITGTIYYIGSTIESLVTLGASKKESAPQMPALQAA